MPSSLLSYSQRALLLHSNYFAQSFIHVVATKKVFSRNFDDDFNVNGLIDLTILIMVLFCSL